MVLVVDEMTINNDIASWEILVDSIERGVFRLKVKTVD